MISIKQIQYALAVGETLHFKRAAEQCNVSQSALSTALAEMERQLGFQVFERNNKSVLVTPLGRRMLEKAQRIKIEVDDLHKLAENESSPLGSQLTIGMIPTVGPSLLPKLLPAVTSSYPEVNLTVVEEQSHILLQRLRHGDIDTAILALPYEHEGLLAFPFWKENFCWVTHKEDPIASLDVVHAEDLDPSRLLLLEEGHCLKDHALAACHFQESATRGLRATSLFTLVQMAAGKMGSTLVPEMSVHQLVAQNSELVSVPLAEPGPHRELAFIVRPNYPNLSAIELLIELLKKVL